MSKIFFLAKAGADIARQLDNEKRAVQSVRRTNLDALIKEHATQEQIDAAQLAYNNTRGKQKGKRAAVKTRAKKLCAAIGALVRARMTNGEKVPQKNFLVKSVFFDTRRGVIKIRATLFGEHVAFEAHYINSAPKKTLASIQKSGKTDACAAIPARIVEGVASRYMCQCISEALSYCLAQNGNNFYGAYVRQE